MFPVGMFPVGMFPPGMFPPGGAGVDKKRGGFGIRRRPIIQYIHKELTDNERETAFAKAFGFAVDEVEKKIKVRAIQEKIDSGELQGVGKIGRLSNEDLILILLLID